MKSAFRKFFSVYRTYLNRFNHLDLENFGENIDILDIFGSVPEVFR